MSSLELAREKDLNAVRVLLKCVASEILQFDPTKTTDTEWKELYASLWHNLNGAAKAFQRLRSLYTSTDDTTELREVQENLRTLLSRFERIAGQSGIEAP